jgi:hypothetical protein
MEALAVIALVVLLMGQWGDKKPEPPAIGGPGQTVNFNRDLLKDCQPLPELADSTDTQMIEQMRVVTKNYADCAVNKNALNREVKKAFNIKDGE